MAVEESDVVRYCERCGFPYSPNRVRTGDYHYRFCSGLCQANAGVPSIRDILSARRKVSVLTESEKDDLEEFARDYFEA